MSPLHRLAPSLAAALLFPAVGAAADRIECTVEVKLHRLVGQGVVAFPREPDLPPERRGLAEVEVSVLSAVPKVPDREADRARCAQLAGLRTLLKVGWKDPERTVRFDPEAPLKLDYIWWDPGVSSPFEVWELPPEQAINDQETANPGSSFLECEVKAKVLKLEKRAAVDAQIAQTLDLPETAIGVLGVAKVEIDVLDAKVRRGQKESCDAMVGKTGTIVVRYPLARQDMQLGAGEVLDLDYFGYAGFAPYGVPGRESWTLKEP